MKISAKRSAPANTTTVRLVTGYTGKSLNGCSKDEKAYVAKLAKDEPGSIVLNRYSHQLVLVKTPPKSDGNTGLEKIRQAANGLIPALNQWQVKRLSVDGSSASEDLVYAFCEGLALGSYQFNKYFNKPKVNATTQLQVIGLPANRCKELENVVASTFFARDLVNEPVRFLNAPQLSREVKKSAKRAGYKVDVFNKSKIEALKMGGLLAVNQGSIDPPTFTIIEWKPKNKKNTKPVVLVGKGVVYDTGGLDIKTGGHMAKMKCDMAGAAAMIGTMHAIATNKIPLHVIALIPATDNRPGKNAYASGDIIKMHDGSFVEVINTDAEGRMLLADALSYAKKYKPELVIDAATLTGAAARALGPKCCAAMGNAEKELRDLEKVGMATHERISIMPFWDDYKDLLKSDIADIKHLYPGEAGAITAGKFLEHFTDYPYIHLDIAGPAMLDRADHYRTTGGTGYGVRLLYNYLKERSQKK